MWSQRQIMLAINIVGGLAVLGSYAYCMLSYPAQVGDFWGDVPDSLVPVYTVNMFLAAAGYFAFSYFIFFRLEPASAETKRPGLEAFNLAYAMILLPSALWMPLTFMMLEAPSAPLWWAIRVTLAVVGIGSLGLLAGLVAARPSRRSLAHVLAIVGSLAFCLQTAVLDALVWPAYFPV